MVERGRATLSCGLRPAGSAAGGVSCRDLWTGRPRLEIFPPDRAAGTRPGLWNSCDCISHHSPPEQVHPIVGILSYICRNTNLNTLEEKRVTSVLRKIDRRFVPPRVYMHCRTRRVFAHAEPEVDTFGM